MGTVKRLAMMSACLFKKTGLRLCKNPNHQIP
jgi:hypothetical protein